MDLAVAVEPLDHVRGPADAAITIVEYGDFECPACAAAESALRQLLAIYPEQVRLVWRHFPLADVHPHAFRAAEAAEAAAAQGRFWGMHHLLIERPARLAPADLERYAGELGLDRAQFRDELESGMHAARVRQHIASGVASHVRGTPGLYVNGRIFDASGGLRPLFAEVVLRLAAIRGVAGAR